MNRMTAFTAAAVAAAVVGFASQVCAEGAAGRIRVGASYRGGMDIKAKGSGSHAALEAASLATSSGKPAVSEEDSYTEDWPLSSQGYTGGDKTFFDTENGEVIPSEWSGTIHADGTYEGGYGWEGGRTFESTWYEASIYGAGYSTKNTFQASDGGVEWRDGDFGGWGLRLDWDLPLGDPAKMAERGFFVENSLGFRAWWGMEEGVSGSGYAGTWRETTTTYGGMYQFKEGWTYVSAEYKDGDTSKLDLENAWVGQGSYEYRWNPDPEGGDEPILPSTHTKRTAVMSVSRIDADVDLYQLSEGISLGVEKGNFRLSARPSVFLNRLDADIERVETLTLANGKLLRSWTDTASGDKWCFGAGIEAMAEYAFAGRWTLWVSGGWEWSEKASWNVGPQKVEIDPSAWTVSTGVGMVF